VPTRTPRRTQEERSAATRAQLIDATIDALVELGYSATTTTVIAERAGVSRGAQLHHYPTKAELVAAAVEHLATKLLERFATELQETPSDNRISHMVDAIRSSFSAPLLAAWVELSVAARTDAELRATIAPVKERVQTQILERAQHIAGNELETVQGLIVLAMTVCLFEGMTVEGLGRTHEDAGFGELQSLMVETWKQMLGALLPES
jgi:AcrR family transcriptional regulator